MQPSTLCFLTQNDRILLAMKKRDFGKGRWNGAGGKVNPGETVEQAAVRELKEELNVVAKEEDLLPMGVLTFHSVNEKLNWKVNIFFLEKWEGDPKESEEMRPQWYPKDQLPFEAMWPDDKYWFPYVLAGKKIRGSFEFDAEGKDFLTYSIEEMALRQH